MKVTIFKPIQTDISMITEQDLIHLSQIQLKELCLSLINSLSHTKTSPTPVKMLKSSPIHHKLGIKRGKTSIYHYVDRVGNKYRARVTIKEKTHHLGSFINEVDAALAVDSYLDSIGDTQRPRNRDEFEL